MSSQRDDLPLIKDELPKGMTYSLIKDVLPKGMTYFLIKDDPKEIIHSLVKNELPKGSSTPLLSISFNSDDLLHYKG